MVPMTESAMSNTEGVPNRMLADVGYKSEENFEALEALEIEAHLALGRGEREGAGSKEAGPASKRVERLRPTKKSRALYNKRKGVEFTVEDFQIDIAKGVAKCPAGKKSIRHERPKGTANHHLVFSRKDCSGCPMRCEVHGREDHRLTRHRQRTVR